MRKKSLNNLPYLDFHSFERFSIFKKENSFRKPLKKIRGESLLSVANAGYLEYDDEHAIFQPSVDAIFENRDKSLFPDCLFVEPKNNGQSFFCGGNFGILKLL